MMLTNKLYARKLHAFEYLITLKQHELMRVPFNDHIKAKHFCDVIENLQIRKNHIEYLLFRL